MDKAEQILRFLEGELPRFLSDLETLVNIDSGTYYRAGVNAVARWMRESLEGLGCDITMYPDQEFGDSVLGTLKGQGQARILMLGHLDTVFPEGTAAARPFKREGNVLKGPGVGDMKAGLLTGCYAMKALTEIGFTDFAVLGFFCNSNEEVGSPTLNELIGDLAKDYDVALALESARENGDIVSARKGTGRYTLTVKGRAAHAGVEPEKGRSAILELAHQIIALHALNGIAPGVTVNVGVIEGGTRSNIVPDFAQAEIDMRSITRQGMVTVEKAVHDLLQKTTVPDVTLSLEGGDRRPPMEKTEAVAYLVGLAQQAAGELGFSVRDAATGGASDANLTAAEGVPSLDGLGPVGGLDHGPDEYLEADSIVPRTAMLARLITLVAENVDDLVEKGR
jgi:glutamate carboxypeptidase